MNFHNLFKIKDPSGLEYWFTWLNVHYSENFNQSSGIRQVSFVKLPWQIFKWNGTENVFED